MYYYIISLNRQQRRVNILYYIIKPILDTVYQCPDV